MIKCQTLMYFKTSITERETKQELMFLCACVHREGVAMYGESISLPIHGMQDF